MIQNQVSPGRMDWSQAKRIYRVGNNVSKQIFLPKSVLPKPLTLQTSWSFSHPEREQDVRTIKVVNKQEWGAEERQREKVNAELHKCLLSMLRIKAENRKEKEKSKHTTKSTFPLLLEKNLLIVPHPNYAE